MSILQTETHASQGLKLECKAGAFSENESRAAAEILNLSTRTEMQLSLTLRGNCTDFTRLFTAFGKYFYILAKSCIKPFGAPEGDTKSLKLPQVMSLDPASFREKN